VSEALSRYSEISQKLVDEFWDELTKEFQQALSTPKANHFEFMIARNFDFSGVGFVGGRSVGWRKIDLELLSILIVHENQ
jgi:hypothetical protein